VGGKTTNRSSCALSTDGSLSVRRKMIWFAACSPSFSSRPMKKPLSLDRLARWQADKQSRPDPWATSGSALSRTTYSKCSPSLPKYACLPHVAFCSQKQHPFSSLTFYCNATRLRQKPPLVRREHSIRPRLGDELTTGNHRLPGASSC